MNHTPKTNLGASRQRLLFVAAAAALALGATGLHGQASGAAPAVSTKKKDQPMKSFAIIFRQGPKPLAEVDLKKRFEETRAWAAGQNAAGHQLEPHILAPEGVWIEPDGASRPLPASAAGAITAVLFLTADDLPQAADIARAHPALRYGASVEVRPWAAPPAPPR